MVLAVPLTYHLLLILLVPLRPATGWTTVPPDTWRLERRKHHFQRHVVVTAKASASDTADRQQQQQQKQVIVVGGGVGGLAIASRIAAANPSCNVTILEKNRYVGGRCGSFEVQGAGGQKEAFRHERGPSLLLLPRFYRELFQDCCRGREKSTPEDYGLLMKACIPAYQVVWNDGDRIDVGFPRSSTRSDAELASRRKMDEIEHEGSKKWDAYMEVCKAFLDCGLPNFIEERLDLSSFPAFLQESLKDFGRCWPLKPHSDVLAAIFTSAKMKSLSSFQDLYVGLEPYSNSNKVGGGVLETTAPAVFGLLAAVELHPQSDSELCGVYAPIGGFQKVTEAFENLAIDLGVRIETDTTVLKVTTDGVFYCRNSHGDTSVEKGQPEFVRADLIVVNADIPYASKVLLNSTDENPITSKIQKGFVPRYDWEEKGEGRPMKYLFSSGVIAFHWSLDRELADLNTHNVFLMASPSSSSSLLDKKDEEETLLRQSWRAVRGDTSSLESFNFYVHRPSKVDPSAAPKVSFCC